MSKHKFLSQITDISKVITPIDSTIRFPEVLQVLVNKYGNAIDVFCTLIKDSQSSAEILERI